MKKGLSMFLSLILVLGVLTSSPLTVSATEPKSILANGICGNNIFWKLDNNGVLTIYGQGKMDNYCYYLEGYFYHPTPWNEFNSSIKKCIIEKGVTYIGIFTFYNCKNLTSIIIPDTVTCIGENAFQSCINLIKITIPDSVTSIGSNAFYDTGCYNDEANWENGVLYIGNHLIEAQSDVSGSCIIKNGTKTVADSAFIYANLSAITLPDTLISIGEYAFYSCTNLVSITIPDSVTSIGSDAFYNTGYYNNETNWENGVLYINKQLISAHKYNEFHYDSLESDYTIKQGTRTIANNAFENCNITSLILPDSLVNIGYSCYKVEDGIQTIDFLAFGNCNVLTSIEVGENNSNYASENGVLFNKDKTELIRYPQNKNGEIYVIPDTVNYINYGAFYSCANLTSVTIPNTVISVGENAFEFCVNLIEVTIPDSITSIGSNAFYNTGCYDDETNWENGTLYIGNYLIKANNEMLQNEYVVKNGTIAIADFAFYNCDVLSTVIISDSVINIGHKALGYGVKTINAYGNREWYKNTDLSIKGVKASIAENYANENGFTFIAICEHTSTKWETVKKATVNSKGKKEKMCTECGEILETATIKQLKCDKPSLKKIENTADGVKIIWAKETGADKYYVYRKTGSSGKYSKIATVKGNSKVTYTDKKAKSGKKYYYYVKAVNEAGSSDSSSSKSILHLADPTLKTPKSTKKGITLNWSKVTGAQGYVIYYKTGSGSYKKLTTVKGNSKVKYTHTKAKKGKTYTYKVKAYYSKTYSAYSNAKKIKDKY